jgi:hypothetical protein
MKTAGFDRSTIRLLAHFRYTASKHWGFPAFNRAARKAFAWGGSWRLFVQEWGGMS